MLQVSVGIAALLLLLDAAAAAGFTLPTPLNQVAAAVRAAQSSEFVRGLIYPIANQLFDGLLPEGLRALLVP